MWYAAQNGNESLVQILLAAGAKFNRLDTADNFAALQAACYLGHVRCAPLLEDVSRLSLEA